MQYSAGLQILSEKYNEEIGFVAFSSAVEVVCLL